MAIKVTGEKKVFDKIWSERNHVSRISGIQLEQFVPTFYFNLFAHILCKKDYPGFRLEPANIVLITPEEHSVLDSGNIDKRVEYSERMFNEYGVVVDWEFLDNTKDELLVIYKELHPSKIVDRNR